MSGLTRVLAGWRAGGLLSKAEPRRSTIPIAGKKDWAVAARSAAVWLCVLVLMGGGGAGCSPLARNKAVPVEMEDQAVVPGMDESVRTWGVACNPEFLEELKKSVPRERAALAAEGNIEAGKEGGPLPEADFLAISGGGQNGAFGAGILCAWTERGGRPEFKVVTGISTGALTAPFVFAGPEYDHVLREVYTKTTTPEILIPLGLLQGFFGDGLADTKPLWRLIEKYVDEKLLEAIAAEYQKGRLLIIGTTNLDARRSMLWNIGEIASSADKEQARELIRKILMASAAIPGAFPPVMINVEVNGEKYQEMHVDGGATAQVFLYPPTMRLKQEAAAAGIDRKRRAYIIRNSRLEADYTEVERQTMPIAMRAIDSLINTQGIGDLYRIYANCRRDDIDFNLAYIPLSFTEKAKEVFDPKYMTDLFNLGYSMTMKGYPWEKAPPGFDSDPFEQRPGAGRN